MTTTFQPGSGDLLIRGPLTQRPDGVGLPSTSRYAWPVKSDGGSSLGSFPSRSSRNPFFARNNPHPSRVKHIKGLLDVPICTILDANHGESRSASQVSRFSLATPTTDQMRQRPLEGILKLPVNINAYRPKEKAIPTMGMVPIVSDWKDELRRITEAAGLSSTTSPRNPLISHKTVPPSRDGLRQSSRQASRQASRNSMRQMENEFVRNVVSQNCSRPAVNNGHSSSGANMAPMPGNNGSVDDRPMQHIVAFPDNERYIFELLGKILHTDSIQAVQTWLVNAPDREKEIVLDMIRAVSSSDEEFREGINYIHSPRDVAKTEPIYEDQLLQHESSLDTEKIKNYNEEQKKLEEEQKKKEQNTTKSILEKLNEAMDQPKPGTSQNKRKAADYEWSVEVNKPSSPFNIFDKSKPRPGTAEAEIEEIRSKLVSRSSAKVFDHQGRPASRRATQSKTGGNRTSSHSSVKKNNVKVITPFAKE